MLLVIITLVCVIGIIVASIQQTSTPVKEQPRITPKPLSSTDLQVRLASEIPAIQVVITSSFPQLSQLYMIEKERLFEQGQWYGAILTYKGTDSDNRDTLRLILQKKGEKWIIRTTPPQIIVSSVTYPDIPKTILDTLNKPSRLPASASSPAITPAQ